MAMHIDRDDADLARDATVGADLEGTDYTVHAHEHGVSQTRWGFVSFVILRDKPTGRFYRFEYELSSGDADYDSLFDFEGEEIELTEVFPHEVTTVEWKTTKP